MRKCSLSPPPALISVRAAWPGDKLLTIRLGLAAGGSIIISQPSLLIQRTEAEIHVIIAISEAFLRNNLNILLSFKQHFVSKLRT